MASFMLSAGLASVAGSSVLRFLVGVVALAGGGFILLDGVVGVKRDDLEGVEGVMVELGGFSGERGGRLAAGIRDMMVGRRKR
jgi:hypothetical protein